MVYSSVSEVLDAEAARAKTADLAERRQRIVERFRPMGLTESDWGLVATAISKLARVESAEVEEKLLVAISDALGTALRDRLQVIENRLAALEPH